ncbi:MAG: biosynthetic peptidoglycan transglycosylase [Candidatus Shapirobacteria bacterium]
MANIKRLWRRRYLRVCYWLDQKIKGRFWLWVSIGAFGVVVLGFLLFLGLLTWYSRDLPSPNQLVRKEGFTTRIYDRNGEVIYDVYKEAKRTPVTWEQVPDYLKWATIAIEDKHFYSHPGFSVGGIARAFFNIVVHHRLQGGSTLTQQLIKNVLLSSERTLPRKFKEFILSLQTERKYTKDEILLMYLNEAPYGGSAWGVGAAAEQYFDKNVSDLSLAESVILAGLPQRPSVYSPFPILLMLT